MLSKTVVPASKHEMRKTEFKEYGTLCQQLRDIYALSRQSSIKMKCRIALAMAKNMDRRLRKYKEAFDTVVQLDNEVKKFFIGATESDIEYPLDRLEEVRNYAISPAQACPGTTDGQENLRR